MKLVTVSGPPASGKTAVIVHLIHYLKQKHLTAGVVKFDCLATGDGEIYARHQIPVQIGLAGNLCPDHYFGGNAEICFDWGLKEQFDYLIIESAGLCNRCSPHLTRQYAICVIDNLMGAEAPRKIGPMLKMADAVAITKGDIVSQAEREIYALQIRRANPKGLILSVNGITGQGCEALGAVMQQKSEDYTPETTLRYAMPAAICTYCRGITSLDSNLLVGAFKEMTIK